MSDPDKQHSAVVGGSSAERVLACSGSIRLTREAGPKPGSAFADEGTALHQAMEWLLRENETPQAALGRTFFGHEIAQAHVDECLAPAIAAFEAIVGPREFEVEVQAPLIDIEGAFGTSDVVYYDDKGRLLGIIDWKFGSGHKVVAAGNAQLMFYLYSQLMRPAAATPLRAVTATVVQLRLQHVDSASFTRKELNRFVWALASAISGPEVFRKGSWCHWCVGKPRCPAHWGVKADKLRRAIDRRAAG